MTCLLIESKIKLSRWGIDMRYDGLNMEQHSCLSTPCLGHFQKVARLAHDERQEYGFKGRLSRKLGILINDGERHILALVIAE